MSGDTIAKQAIRYFLSIADVVYDKVPLVIVGSLFYYDSDVCNSFPKIPGYDVAGFIIHQDSTWVLKKSPYGQKMF